MAIQATSYKPLPPHTLVAFERAGKYRIAYIVGHSLDVSRKPGIDRVVYQCQPCTIDDAGRPNDWGRMFYPVVRRAQSVSAVTPERAAEMLRTGEAKNWS